MKNSSVKPHKIHESKTIEPKILGPRGSGVSGFKVLEKGNDLLQIQLNVEAQVIIDLTKSFSSLGVEAHVEIDKVILRTPDIHIFRLFITFRKSDLMRCRSAVDALMDAHVPVSIR